MPEPAWLVTLARVAVCPVNHTAFGVPLVHAAERHSIAFAKADNSRRQIYVVRDEQRLARAERRDEALMAAIGCWGAGPITESSTLSSSRL